MPTRLPLLLVLLFLATLLMAAGAHGATVPAIPVPLAFEEPLEDMAEEEGEAAETECDTAYEEADEGVLSEAEAEEVCDEEEAEESRKKAKDNPGGQAPEECVLRSAHAHAAVNEKAGKLKLTLGYTAYEPIDAKIKVGNLATLKRQLGRSGVLRLVEPLRKDDLKRLVVQIKLPSVKRAGCPARRLVLFPR